MQCKERVLRLQQSPKHQQPSSSTHQATLGPEQRQGAVGQQVVDCLCVLEGAGVSNLLRGAANKRYTGAYHSS